MRSTRATAAVEKLKRRSGNSAYTLVRTAGDLFYLGLSSDTGTCVPQCEALPMDEFVQFVDRFGPQIQKRVSKLDMAFEARLVRKKK